MIYRVSFIAHVGSMQFVNTLHLEARADLPFGDAGNPSPADVADKVKAALADQYVGMLATNATLDRIAVATVPRPGDSTQISQWVRS